jgi:hypothetical protein
MTKRLNLYTQKILKQINFLYLLGCSIPKCKSILSFLYFSEIFETSLVYQQANLFLKAEQYQLLQRDSLNMKALGIWALDGCNCFDMLHWQIDTSSG